MAAIPFHPDTLRAAADDAVASMKLLGNADRLLLLCQLSQGEMRVGQLEAALHIHQPTLSQQLAVLRKERAVDTRREGKHIHYRIADPKLLQIMDLLFHLYCPKDRP